MSASFTRSVMITKTRRSVAMYDVAADGNCLFSTLGLIVQPQISVA